MPRTDKTGSWQWMTLFYKASIKLQGERLVPLLELVKTIAASDDASRFRVGQSVYALIISTTSNHWLEQDNPHVVVKAERTDDLFVLEYWSGRKRNDLLVSSTCQESELLVASLRYLSVRRQFRNAVLHEGKRGRTFCSKLRRVM